MKYSGIGGQAVMEGVMMKNGDSYAVAVRKPNQEIVVEVSKYQGLVKNKKIRNLPLLRGVFSFAESLVLGMRTLAFSASFFDEEEAAPKGAADEKRNAVPGEAPARERAVAAEEAPAKERADATEEAPARERTDAMKEAPAKEQADATEEAPARERADAMKEAPARERADATEEVPAESRDADAKGEGLFMGATIAFSVVLAVAIFVMLPYGISLLFQRFIASRTLLALLEGLIRLAIFISYVALISLMPDIRRVYMYHGAEHKCINCVEHGMDLTVENVRKSSKEHKRCGTSFLLIVMLVSIVFFMFIRVDSGIIRLLLRLVLIPVIAGVSYEFIRLAGRSDAPLVNALSKPGLLLQRLTTREPDDSMIEVGIASVEAVFDWKEYIRTAGNNSD